MIKRYKKIYLCNGQEHCRYNAHCQEQCFYTTSEEFAKDGHRMLEYERMIEKGDRVAFIYKKVGNPIQWDERKRRRMMYLKDGLKYTDIPSQKRYREDGTLIESDSGD